MKKLIGKHSIENFLLHFFLSSTINCILYLYKLGWKPNNQKENYILTNSVTNCKINTKRNLFTTHFTKMPFLEISCIWLWSNSTCLSFFFSFTYSVWVTQPYFSSLHLNICHLILIILDSSELWNLISLAIKRETNVSFLFQENKCVFCSPLWTENKSL